MDRQINLALLRPTAVSGRPDSPMDTDNIENKRSLVNRLQDQTRAIEKCPYDPRLWATRAFVLDKLGYPELAAGDYWKAQCLCRRINSVLDIGTGDKWRLGSGCGFWMREESEGERTDVEYEKCYALLDQLQNRENETLRSWVLHYESGVGGLFVPQAYPWLSEEHAERSDELIAAVNQELAAISIRRSDLSCEIRRCTFGSGDGNNSVPTVLGVFALHDMSAGTALLTDKSEIFGCIGPGSGGSSKNLHGGRGCLEALHPNIDNDDASMDLSWIRDRLGKQSAEPIMLCRALLACVQQGVKHPLDQSDIARLTPAYHTQEEKRLALEADIAIPNEALQQFGIDVFANVNYDTWVLFTISARLDNNTWSDPSAACLNSLFSLFNHSCDPNVKWATQDDHLTVCMRTAKEVRKGDQLFVEYDSFMHDCSLDERRERLSRWIDGPCMCDRCVQESKELDTREVGAKRKAMGQAHHNVPQAQTVVSFDGPSDELDSNGRPCWDRSEKPVLPEDFPSYWR